MPHRLLPAAIALALAACAAPPIAEREPDETDADPMLADAGIAYSTVAETFVTARTPDDNIDSPAAWRAPDGKTWLLATAKEGERLVIYDGDTGATIRTHGSPGDGAGQFRRANGIFVSGDLVFVVERDNRRVQVLELPSLRTLGTFGSEELLQPYGLWLQPQGDNGFDLLVTDAYMAGEDANGDDITPPLVQLDRRVHRYAVSIDADGGASARHVGSFGDTTEAGAIRIPESLWGDPMHDRLLISEEDTVTGTAVREYDIAGHFRGRTIGLGTFKAQAEGLALWACPDGSGYWLATDQFKDHSLFHVYDRVSLEHLGAFAGNTVSNTDGVWLQQSATTRFPDGVFYAVHDDQAVGAFDWRDIARTLKLRMTCAD